MSANEDLEKWFLEQPLLNFPAKGRYNYHQRFQAVRNYLETEIYPHVEKGALLRDGEYLTNHGLDHVQTVVRRAGELIGDPRDRMSPYEAYLLIMAAYFHDVGNIFGREEHERKAADVMSKMGALLGQDIVEIRSVKAIARAHGGSINGSKDTISSLPVKEYVLNVPVRKQFLAAVLRFADELADDCHRAARTLLDLGAVAPESEIFHQYARHLHSVIIDHPARAINLHFALTKDVVVRRFSKKQKRRYLLDEIFERTLKMHKERIYCMRFMEGVIRIDTIGVNIDVFLSQDHLTPVHKLGYRLEEKGYPSGGAKRISDLCPEFRWTAQSLKSDLDRHRGGDE